MRYRLSLLALLPLAACGTEATDSGSQAPPAAPQTLADVVPSAQATEHAVVCGCALEEVGHCSEWIDVEGEWVELELPIDMGSMPFCRKDGLVAKVDGEVQGETFVATTFAYVEN
ncbi:MAG: hypothetical protein AAFZ65_12575 [Planctomycetota bacterium]